MKLRLTLLIFLAVFLTACNFSLAEDITPPPNYIAPTPLPTLGPLYPAQAPDIENGAAIYAEKCVDCHGPQGMGDGDKGKQLPVTVAALGLPQVAWKASPADWYTMVSRGNIERFMPPFISLSEQERWDVVAYALTLHTTEADLKRGRELYDFACGTCPADLFRNQEWMASISNEGLIQFLRDGDGDFPGLASVLTEGGFTELAYYVRTLSFAVTLPTPTPEPATPTPAVSSPEATVAVTDTTPAAETTPTVEGTPATETSATPVAPEATATPVTTGIRISGSVSGPNVSGLTVTLRGFDHATGASSTEEVVTLTAVTDADGNYVFEGLEVVENRIFFVEAEYFAVTYSSEPLVLTADSSDLTIAEISVYEITSDFSSLVFEQAHFFIEVADGTLQVIGVYTFSNTGTQTIAITTPMEVPFLKAPADAQNVGYDLTQDSAPILAVGETGFAMPPSEIPYGFVMFYTLPYNGKAQIQQPFVLDASSILVLVPEGIKTTSSQLVAGEMQTFQETNYQSFAAADLKSGDILTINLSGQPRASGDSRQGLLIGVGALGAVLILAGAWMYLRDRNRSAEDELDEEEEDEMESEEDLLDAIIALDDLHRAGKIDDKAYQTRRAELKARLKEVM